MKCVEASLVLRRIGFFAVLLALAAVPALAQDEAALDKGDTAWILISTALVIMMTAPGLALFPLCCKGWHSCPGPWPRR